MATTHKILDIGEVRKRAAEIRRQWSPLEKLQRTGLPPDMPPNLCDYFSSSPPRAWCVASIAAGHKTSPRR
jgi:hypothetical protein